MDLLFCDLKDWNMFFFKYVKDVLYVYGDEVRGLCASLNSIVLRRWRRLIYQYQFFKKHFSFGFHEQQ